MTEPHHRHQRHRQDDRQDLVERYRGLAADVIAKLLEDAPVAEWDLDLLADNMVSMVARWEETLPPCESCGRPAWNTIMSSGAKQWCGICGDGQ